MDQYESFFAAHGFEKEARDCQACLAEDGHSDNALDKVPDEMVTAFVAVGSRDKVLQKIEPMWGVADSMCPTPPLWSLPPEKVGFYVEAIGAMIAEQVQ
jgi:hypothetical protein